MTAIYNEIESYACDWLQNLITAGHIANGRVERRSIKDLGPGDVAGAGQRHFFAGIGVWSYALRLAGVPDGFPVWTGSCPCQPFSQAGVGGGIDDPRHLWPVWFPLIERCRPAIVLGEQVASPAGLEWLDAVFSDLEGAGYACAAADLCAAGVGAPHIRQRLYFVAYADAAGWREQWRSQLLDRQRATQRDDADGRSPARWMGDASGFGSGRDPRAVPRAEAEGRSERGEPRRFAHESFSSGTDGRGPAQRGSPTRCAGLEERERERGDDGAKLQTAERAGGAVRWLADNSEPGRLARGWVGNASDGRNEARLEPRRLRAVSGFWADADWLPCLDGKARPVEPGTFPLAHGAPARVGRLRAYGNAINAQVAATFITAALEAA